MEDLFRFKRFTVSNSHAGLKVGTDAVLLGASVELPSSLSEDGFRVLDIGTGTGVIALMLSQRLSDVADGICLPGTGSDLDFSVLGIDIDPLSASEAGSSFAASAWSEHLEARHVSLQDYAEELRCRGAERTFDLIVSNPPYYDESLTAPDAQRSAARHTESLSYREVISFASDTLAPSGHLAMILPKEEETRLLRFAASFGLKPVRLLSVRTTPSKPPKRIIAQFCRSEACCRPVEKQTLTIQDGGAYTAEYRALTGDFYLSF